LTVGTGPGARGIPASSSRSDKDLVTGVGFQRRYHPMAHACWEQVRQKGEVHQVVSCFYKNQAPQEVHPYYRGAIDILHCDAIHAVDAMRYYCGLSDVREVTSEVRSIDCWYAVSFSAIVHFENDAEGILLANWRTGRRLLKFEFHACGASAYVDVDGTAEVWSDNRKEPDMRMTCASFSESEEMYVNQGFRAENRAFIDAVRTGSMLHNSLQDSVKSMELVDAIYNNAINGHEQNARSSRKAS
jgi:predicted dehydrogenase